MDVCEVHFWQNQQNLLMNLMQWVREKNVNWLDSDVIC